MLWNTDDCLAFTMVWFYFLILAEGKNLKNKKKKISEKKWDKNGKSTAYETIATLNLVLENLYKKCRYFAKNGEIRA